MFIIFNWKSKILENGSKNVGSSCYTLCCPKLNCYH